MKNIQNMAMVMNFMHSAIPNDVNYDQLGTMFSKKFPIQSAEPSGVWNS